MSSLPSDNISLKTWRLKGSEDWPIWKQEVSVILESQDLWDLTDTTTPCLSSSLEKCYRSPCWKISMEVHISTPRTTSIAVSTSLPISRVTVMNLAQHREEGIL